ncbi:MAG: methionine adenosyltransferase [Erysipelotrichaceae bacterium]|nr:methionine adenosyltransferase [Erysipelotrichaceae bacterium]
MKSFMFTSESVTDGHPDKVCDQIADAILDEAIRQDPESHMAVEASIKDELVMIFGEANTKATLNFEKIAKDVIKDIGYEEEYRVITKVGVQSPEINTAVANNVVSAGDQGMMFGYASNETPALMPAPIYYAHLLSKRLSDFKREDNRIKPDGKTQVTVEYEDGKVKRIECIVVSAQHDKDLSQKELKELIMKYVIKPTLPAELLDENTKYYINPSGSFAIGGSWGDSGTTGRKIIVDTYGGMGRVGGGCFSSKDPSKVDRSAAYYCRYVAKNIVAHGLADKCEIQVAYAIGMNEPLSLYIDTFGTNHVTEEDITAYVNRNFDFKVSNIIDELDLKRPIYRQTTNFGHFGHPESSWEQIKETK